MSRATVKTLQAASRETGTSLLCARHAHPRSSYSGLGPIPAMPGNQDWHFMR
jgi:hypothetical protein